MIFVNLLVVEDDAVIREGIIEFLTMQNYHVFEAENGEYALEILKEHTIHLMILDIMLPKLSGLEVLKEVRKYSTLPIIMLTAMNDERIQVHSFDQRADDYICKPFSIVLLGKRVEALLRREYKQINLWEYGSAVVDFTGFSATFDGQDAALTPKEINLLALLLQHQGQVLTREQTMEHLWCNEEAPYDRVIDVYIKNLRKKLHLECIVTVKGIGYKLEL